MSDIIKRLEAARGLAWADMQPVFNHAIVLAKEAEHDANRAMNIAMTGTETAYPPLVLLLAESVPAPKSSDWPSLLYPEPDTFTGPGYEAHPGHDHEDCCK